ncbi:hypothetical protein CLU95_1335 [Variovorax sp. 54]|uniref:hypothetical protein n=1 Tax=Variovorax sp. 54 TaxID=2035212 RepID=UPI000C5570AC|nr:hypothetical protein [Variovorax sp. 54]PIF74214.1 hypothetical protein CLU95_1335 [Variovorax sp. 54]
MKFMAIMIGLCLQPFAAEAAITNETACYVSSDAKSVRFEFHTYHDSNRKWSAGFVRYENSRESIPVTFFSSTSASDLGEGIHEPSTKWLEIWRGKVTGEYVLKREGAGAGVSGYVATYRNYAGNRVRNFVLDPTAGFEESGCNWAN